MFVWLVGNLWHLFCKLMECEEPMTENEGTRSSKAYDVAVGDTVATSRGWHAVKRIDVDLRTWEVVVRFHNGSKATLPGREPVTVRVG